MRQKQRNYKCIFYDFYVTKQIEKKRSISESNYQDFHETKIYLQANDNKAVYN